MIATLLLAAPLLVQQRQAQAPQTPPAQAAPVAGTQPAVGAAASAQSDVGTIVTPVPSIQAPTQPTGRSRDRQDR